MKISIKNNINIYLASALMLIACFIYVQMILSVSSNYHPIWSDEFFYVVNANAFQQNNSLQAAFTYNGIGSQFFSADAHGIAYPLLNGAFAKIAGNSNTNFIILNFILFAITLTLVISLKSLKLQQKLYILSSLMLFPFFQLYAFTYMQEVIHLLFAVCLGILIFKINLYGLTKKYLLTFVLLVFMAGVFRSLWFFWLIALIPFANNKRQQLFLILLFLVGIFFSFIFSYLFAEAVPNFFTQAILLLQNENYSSFIKALWQNFIGNANNYLFNFNASVVYFSIKLIVFIIWIFFVMKAFLTKSKLHAALALIGFVNFFLLMFFYEANYWKEIRTMSPLFYFYILFLIPELKQNSINVLVLILFVLFGYANKTTRQYIAQRNSVFNGNKVVINELNKMKQILPAKSSV